MDLDKSVQMVEKYVNNYAVSRKGGIFKVLDDYGERYFTAPASSKESHHCSFVGGLVEHSLNVTKKMFLMSKVLEPERIDDPDFRESILIVGLFHDLGKIGTHDDDGGLEMYVPQTDKWRREKLGENYTYSELNDGIEHAERSVQLLMMSGLDLNKEERGAIRFHDGLYVESNRTPSVYYMDNHLSYIAHYSDHWVSWVDEKVK